jgi:hypothetical protein
MLHSLLKHSVLLVFKLHEVVPLFKASRQVHFIEMGKCIRQYPLSLLIEQGLLTIDINSLVGLGLVQLSNVVVQLFNGTHD